MQTTLLSIYAPTAQTTALALLNANQVIAAPTDTVYGLMARFDRQSAIEKLYEIKNRPTQRAIPVLIGNLNQLSYLTPTPVSDVARCLFDAFWPGALTVVLPALSSLLPILTAHQPTIGVRMPDHPTLRALIQVAGPLAATSANRSGAADAHTAAEVLAQLGEQIPLLLTDESINSATRNLQPSTIVDLTHSAEKAPRILRAGPIALAVKQLLRAQFGYIC
ncbi:MAG: L-threonylcarbamoyladenylate synthase [Chloroflexota bacterium]|nr:L-threonylcarbamoyladenylate synthase [Chloroflexota bacterium]